MARLTKTYTLDEEVIERIQDVSKETMIPQSRLVEQAVIEYLDKMDQNKTSK